MPGVELADNRLVFEDILEAVQESRRGRWFLHEFENRIQKRDTSTILDAIAKLENRLHSPENQSASPEEVARVRSAIAGARNDLLKMGLGKQALSEEGRMFAKLAELAKATLPSNDTSPVIIRSLQLVDEIDKVISPSTQGSKLFAADAHLFETASTPPSVAAPAPSPVAAVAVVNSAATEAPAPIVSIVPAAPKKEEPANQTGAKLVIRKTNQAKPADVDAAPSVAADSQVPEQAIAAETQTQVSSLPDHPRIIITRRKPDDMPEVKIDEPMESSSAA